METTVVWLLAGLRIAPVSRDSHLIAGGVLPVFVSVAGPEAPCAEVLSQGGGIGKRT